MAPQTTNRPHFLEERDRLSVGCVDLVSATTRCTMGTRAPAIIGALGCEVLTFGACLLGYPLNAGSADMRWPFVVDGRRSVASFGAGAGAVGGAHGTGCRALFSMLCSRGRRPPLLLLLLRPARVG
jgi:hypothetical protein